MVPREFLENLANIVCVSYLGIRRDDPHPWQIKVSIPLSFSAATSFEIEVECR